MKILEQNGIENENVDGSAFNNFVANGRNGILKGILDECLITQPSSNSVTIGTGEIIVQGFRIKIDSPVTFTLTSTPSSAVRYQVIATIELSDSKEVTGSINYRLVGELTQDDLYNHERGIYQAEILRFTHSADGLEDIVRTMDFITVSGGGSSAELSIGNVTTQTLRPGMEAEVDVENRYDEENKKWVTDFQFYLPSGPQGEQGKQGEQGEQGKQGEQGIQGPTGNGISSYSVTYQSSTSGTTIPTGTWTTSIPSVSQGSYLWTKTVLTFTNGSSSTSYSVARMGSDTTVTVDTALSSTSTNPVQNKVINTALSGKAPTSHASSATTYGVGNSSYYGHVKLSDSTSSTSSTTGGFAATPKAISDAISTIKSAVLCGIESGTGTPGNCTWAAFNYKNSGVLFGICAWSTTVTSTTQNIYPPLVFYSSTSYIVLAHRVATADYMPHRDTVKRVSGSVIQMPYSTGSSEYHFIAVGRLDSSNYRQLKDGSDTSGTDY